VRKSNTDKLTDRQIDRQTDRQSGRQIDKQTDRYYEDKHVHSGTGSLRILNEK